VVAYGTDFTGDKEYGFAQPQWNQSAPDFGCYVLLPPNISVDNFNQQLSAYCTKGSNLPTIRIAILSNH
jgi:hypothetical protein